MHAQGSADFFYRRFMCAIDLYGSNARSYILRSKTDGKRGREGEQKQNTYHSYKYETCRPGAGLRLFLGKRPNDGQDNHFVVVSRIHHVEPETDHAQKQQWIEHAAEDE